MKRTEIGVALLGFGNVGSGTYKALEENFALIEKKVGAKVVIKKILVLSFFLWMKDKKQSLF